MSTLIFPRGSIPTSCVALHYHHRQHHRHVFQCSLLLDKKTGVSRSTVHICPKTDDPWAPGPGVLTYRLANDSSTERLCIHQHHCKWYSSISVGDIVSIRSTTNLMSLLPALMIFVVCVYTRNDCSRMKRGDQNGAWNNSRSCASSHYFAVLVRLLLNSREQVVLDPFHILGYRLVHSLVWVCFVRPLRCARFLCRIDQYPKTTEIVPQIRYSQPSRKAPGNINLVRSRWPYIRLEQSDFGFVECSNNDIKIFHEKGSMKRSLTFDRFAFILRFRFPLIITEIVYHGDSYFWSSLEWMDNLLTSSSCSIIELVRIDESSREPDWFFFKLSWCSTTLEFEIFGRKLEKIRQNDRDADIWWSEQKSHLVTSVLDRLL